MLKKTSLHKGGIKKSNTGELWLVPCAEVTDYSILFFFFAERCFFWVEKAQTEEYQEQRRIEMIVKMKAAGKKAESFQTLTDFFTEHFLLLASQKFPQITDGNLFRRGVSP